MNHKYRKIVLTGGGTMGHIKPHLSILPDLMKYFDTIDYIGSQNGIEKETISKYPIVTYHSIPATKFDRSNILKNITIPFVLFDAIKQAKKILKELQPDVIFSKGGYVSVPVVLAGKSLGIPTIIHESDLTLGLANKIASKHATIVCTTFPETAKHLSNGVWIGSPIDPRLEFANPENARKKFTLDRKRPTITITGGSLGASAINDAIEHHLPELVKKFNIIHLTGKNKAINFSHKYYHQMEFSDSVGEIFKASDLVISRAGSNTIFELALLKTPMLLIPLPKNASRGDQIENAKYFRSLGLAEVLQQSDLNDKLLATIDKCLLNKTNFKRALINADYKNGKDNLVRQILKTIKLK